MSEHFALPSSISGRGALSLWAACALVCAAEAQERGRLIAVESGGDAGASSVDVIGDRPLSFTTLRLHAPPRVVVDFADAELSGIPRELAVDDGTIVRVAAAAAGQRTARVVIELAGEAEFDVRAEGNRVQVRVPRLAPLVASAETKREEKAPPAATAVTATPEPPAAATQAVPPRAEDPASAARRAAVERATAAQKAARDRRFAAQEKAAADKRAAAEKIESKKRARALAAAEQVARAKQAQADAIAAKAAAKRAAAEKAAARRDAAAEQVAARRAAVEKAAASRTAAAADKPAAKRAGAEQAAGAGQPRMVASAAASGSHVITGIGFRPIGAGEVIVRSDRPLEYGVSVEGDAVLLHLAGATIPVANNRRPLDTHFFNGPVQRVVPLAVAGGTDLRIELRGRAEYRLAQSGGVLTVTFSAPP